MSYNAELWTRPDEVSKRNVLIHWLKEHNVDFTEDMDTEELRRLYINIECGNI